MTGLVHPVLTRVQAEQIGAGALRGLLLLVFVLVAVAVPWGLTRIKVWADSPPAGRHRAGRDAGRLLEASCSDLFCDCSELASKHAAGTAQLRAAAADLRS